MTRRIAFADAPETAQADFGHYQTECSVFDVPGQTWGAWWARYGADYIENWLDDSWVPTPAVEENAAEAVAPAGLAASAVQIVPGCAHGSAAVQRTPERPAGRRSLRNSIAHELEDSLVWPIGVHPHRVLATHRQALEAARIALEVTADWVLLFGPQALIDEVTR